MLFVPSAREDIGKYFLKSYLKFKETGDTLFYLNHVDTSCISGQIEDGRDFKLYLAEEEPYEVDYILPHKSFFQFGEHAAMLERIPAKQYHRGITCENTRVSYKLGGAVQQLPLGFEVLKNFVKKKKFSSLSEAVKEGVYSAALSPRMMYVRSTRSVYVDFLPVARIVGPHYDKISMSAPIFKQEIVDFLRATQETEMFTFSSSEKREKP